MKRDILTRMSMSSMSSLSRPAVRTTAILVLVAALLGLSACGGDPTHGRTPRQALAAAQKQLDKTSGIDFSISTDDLPEGITSLQSATGTLTRSPEAFQGTLTVPVMGVTAKIPVTAVGGKVWAKLPFTSSYQAIDPTKYGVPDPTSLIEPRTGISSLLPAAQGVKLGKSVRGGEDNKQILSTYTGTLPGSTVAKILPSATGSFRATYVIDDSSKLSEASITGRFNGADQPANTYTVKITGWDVTKKITAP